jgi:hypothetical protein
VCKKQHASETEKNKNKKTVSENQKGENVCFLSLHLKGRERGGGLKGIVARDWKGLQIVSLDRFEV